VYRNIVRLYGRLTGLDIDVNGLWVHSMLATAATNALQLDADIAKVQEWLGHANVSTTRLYDRRKMRPESPQTSIEQRSWFSSGANSAVVAPEASLRAS
jgi:integrase/recombinase XerD